MPDLLRLIGRQDEDASPSLLGDHLFDHGHTGNI